jgi:hypothetical protein
MSFLYPQLLFGLLALSIPIIVHLFNFRRTKKVYYSSTHFLQLVKEASTSKLKLKHLLILLSRLLFIFFLVIAFAQPFLPARQKGLDSSQVHIYLDNSLSMSSQVGTDYRALDAGIAFINELVLLFPQGTQYNYMTNDFSSSSSEFKSSTELSDLTTETNFSGNARNFGEVWSRLESRISETDNQNQLRKEVFWISDFQKSTAGEIGLSDMDSTIRINVFPLEFEASSNLFIDSVYFDNPFLLGNEKVVLSVLITNSGNVDAEDVPIKIFLNEVQASNASVNVPAFSSITQTFDLGFNLESTNTGRINIEDYPVTFDNDFFFMIDLGKKVSVMEIKSSSEITAIQSVYGNETLFDFVSYSFTNIDYSQINQTDLVVLNELESIDPSLTILLGNFLENGGTLVVIPSENPDLNSYQSLMGSRRLTRMDSLYRQTLSTPDLDNPFYRNVFEEQQSNIAMPEATQVISWGMDRTAILQFRSGIPFLSRYAQSGSTYWFSGPLDDNSSGFQNHAVFVPVMYKIAFGSKNIDNSLYQSVDAGAIKLVVDSINQNTIVKLEGKESEFIPSQRITSGSLYIELPPENIDPGFYRVMAEDRELTTLAFNYNTKESRLDQYSLNELDTIFAGSGNINTFSAKSESEFTSTLRKQYKGTPLWKYALLLALVFLLSEVLLIRFL